MAAPVRRQQPLSFGARFGTCETAAEVPKHPEYARATAWQRFEVCGRYCWSRSVRRLPWSGLSLESFLGRLASGEEPG